MQFKESDMQLRPKHIAFASALAVNPSTGFAPSTLPRTQAIAPFPKLKSDPSNSLRRASTSSTALAAANFDWITPEMAAYGKLGIDVLFSFAVSSRTIALSDKVKANTDNEVVKLGIDLAAAFLIIQCLNLCSGDIQQIQAFNEPIQKMLRETNTNQLQQAVGQLTDMITKTTPPLN